jgi:hypothetical protein
VTDHVLTALTKRRADLVTEVRQAEVTLNRILADIEHIDGAIRQFNPGYRPRRPRTILTAPERGSMVKSLLAVMRAAGGPLTVREITGRIMAGRGIDPTDRKKVTYVTARVRAALSRQRQNGTLAAEPGGEPGPQQAWLWRITT